MEALGTRSALKATPNITPLVDVVLVLLIQFLVLIPAVQATVQLPRAGHASRTLGHPPVFLVGQGAGGAWVAQEEAGALSGRAPLADPIAVERVLVDAGPELTRAGGMLLLKADAGLPFAEIHHWLEACRALGVREALAATQGLEARPEVP